MKRGLLEFTVRTSFLAAQKDDDDINEEEKRRYRVPQ
jgi:hypothetical protein